MAQVSWAAEQRRYSLKALEEVTLKVHPGLQTAREEVRKNEAELRIAKQYPNPTLEGSISGERTIEESPRTGAGYSIALSQTIEWPGRRAKNQEAARFGIEAAEKKLGNEEVNIRARLREFFYRLLADEYLLKIAQENLNTAKNLLESVEKRVRLGETRQLELIKAQVEFSTLEREHQKAMIFLDGERKALNQFLLGNLAPDFVIQGDFTKLDEAVPLKRWRQAALANHPLLAAQEASIRQAKSALGAARQAWMPDVTVRGFYNNDIDIHAAGGGVSVPLPLWNRKGGEVARAAAAKSQAQYELQLIRQDLETSLVSQYSIYEAARKQIETYQESLLPKAKESLRLADLSFQHGETSFLELLDSRRVYWITEQEYYKALLDYWLARVGLWKIAGGGI